MSIKGLTIENYRKDLTLTCGIDDNFLMLQCEIWNITNSQFYFKWEIEHRFFLKEKFSEEKISEGDLLQIYPDQFLVSAIGSNNSIVFYSSRDGSYQFEIENEKPPKNLKYNKFNNILTFYTETRNPSNPETSLKKVKIFKILGEKNKQIPNCIVSIPEKEVCLKCSNGLYTSLNRSSCWEEIPSNWYSYTWGHGAGNYILVRFKFGDSSFENLDILPEKFVEKLSVENVRIEFKGESNPERYFSLEDETTDYDVKRLSKRFRVEYNRDFTHSDVSLRFIYPQFKKTVQSCPFFSVLNLEIFEVNTYFPTSKIPSFGLRIRILLIVST